MTKQEFATLCRAKWQLARHLNIQASSVDDLGDGLLSLNLVVGGITVQFFYDGSSGCHIRADEALQALGADSFISFRESRATGAMILFIGLHHLQKMASLG